MAATLMNGLEMGKGIGTFLNGPPDPARQDDAEASTEIWPPPEPNTRTPRAPPEGPPADAQTRPPVGPPGDEYARQPRLIGTRYQIERTIHTTESSRVSEAIDLWEKQRIAIKEMKRPVDCDDEEWRELLLRFERSARTPVHPNIVRTDKEIRDDVPFIKMELIKGGDLDDRIYGRKVRGEHPDEQRREKRPKPPTPAEIKGIMDDLFRALDYTHMQGIIHRDIKPANILRASDTCWKLTDFGIARFESGLATRYGTFMGTLAYSSPEQIRGEAVDARTDIYSCGVVLYELLAGLRPFRGSNETVKRKIDDGSALAPSLVPTQFRSTNDIGLLTALDKVVMRAMARDREKRYASIADFQTELNAALTGFRPPPPPPPPPPLPMRWLIGLGALGLLLAGIATVAYRFYSGVDQREPAPPPVRSAPPPQLPSVPLPIPAPTPPPALPEPSTGPGSSGFGNSQPYVRPFDPGRTDDGGGITGPLPGETGGHPAAPNDVIPEPVPPVEPPITTWHPPAGPGNRIQPPDQPPKPHPQPIPKPLPGNPPGGGSSSRTKPGTPIAPPGDAAPLPVPPDPSPLRELELPRPAKPSGTLHGDIGLSCRLVTAETAPELNLPEANSRFLKVEGVATGSIADRAGIRQYDAIQATGGITAKDESGTWTSCQAYTRESSGTVPVQVWRNGAWLKRTFVFP
nr:serine/threonine-protein kinase [uncultured Rhodopila sp.]